MAKHKNSVTAATRYLVLEIDRQIYWEAGAP